MTSKAEFVERWRHEFGGLVFDALVADQRGADLSLRMRLILQKIDSHLVTMYEQLRPVEVKPEPKPSVNGVVNQRK